MQITKIHFATPIRHRHGGRRAATKLLTRDEGRRIAVNIAKLPDLLLR